MEEQQQRAYLLAQGMEEVPLLSSDSVIVKRESVTQNLGGKVCLCCTEVCLYNIIMYSLP